MLAFPMLTWLCASPLLNTTISQYRYNFISTEHTFWVACNRNRYWLCDYSMSAVGSGDNVTSMKSGTCAAHEPINVFNSTYHKNCLFRTNKKEHKICCNFHGLFGKQPSSWRSTMHPLQFDWVLRLSMLIVTIHFIAVHKFWSMKTWSWLQFGALDFHAEMCLTIQSL